ncbi:MAG: pseudaminic acid synthase [Legionellaceae bacterium]|nr:pseudaminic acid synthase [Legionellaceae bacterium]
MYLHINGQKIGDDSPPYIIAELSANHNGNLDKALQLIKLAKDCGADAVKIQTYRPDTITLKCNREEFIVRGGIWDGKTLYDLYEEAHTPWEWHPALFDYAREIGITIFSSPFDQSAVDLLEELNTPAYKIASFEAIDLPLIRYVARTGKPMIISTGMANSEEIEEAINAAREGGCRELAILHCVSGYPAPAADYNLRTIADMIQRFGLVTGLSDHTLDNTTAITSIAMGASIIEKHFTLDRNAGGPDDSFSLEPKDLQQLCQDSKTAWQALGSVDYGQKSSEKANVQFRRSLYYVRDVEKGTVLATTMIRSVRPGYGISPKFIDDVIGRPLLKRVHKNSPVKFEDFGDGQ